MLHNWSHPQILCRHETVLETHKKKHLVQTPRIVDVYVKLMFLTYCSIRSTKHHYIKATIVTLISSSACSFMCHTH